MGCRLCFCVSPRAAARFVGILDLILGFVGILFSASLLEISVEDDSPKLTDAIANQTSVVSLTTRKAVTDQVPDVDDTLLWVMAVGLIFPAVLTLIVGITLLISVSKSNLCIARLAYVLNIFLIVGAIAVYAILFVLGYHWLYASPVLIWAMLQILFLCAVHDFIRMDLNVETV